MIPFKNASVLVTGGTSGIGHAAVRHLALKGARVTFCGLHDARGRAIARALGREGLDVRYVHADVTDSRAMAGFIRGAASRNGPFVLALNNAGINHPPALVQDHPPVRWRRVMDVNVMGIVNALRHELPHMAEGGLILNVASILGHRAAAWMGPYGAAKHAVVGLTRTAAQENDDSRLRIYSLSPGPVKTPMFRRALRQIDGDPAKYAGGLPADKDLLSPADVMDVIDALADGRLAPPTGADIVITAGGTAVREAFS